MCPAPPCELYVERETRRQFLLPLEVAACESVQLDHAKGAASAAAPLAFRGKPIAWAVTQQTRSVVEKNAFGADEIEERPGRKLNLIWYGGMPYQKEAFYKMAF